MEDIKIEVSEAASYAVEKVQIKCLLCVNNCSKNYLNPPILDLLSDSLSTSSLDLLELKTISKLGN